MLKTLRQILFFFVIFIMSACISDELKQAESTMATDPAFALTILEEIKPDYTEMSERDKALFGVLYFQALNKNTLDLSPLEMIDFSLDYFLRKRDKYYLSYAQFYKERYLRHNKQYSNSVKMLLQSLDLAEHSRDESLMAKIYFDLGYIALRQDEFEKSKDYYERSADLFCDLNKSDNYVNSLCGLGMIHNKLKDYAKAYEYYHDALRLCVDSLTKGILLYEIGNNYYEQLEFDSAFYYINQSLNYPFIGNNKSLRHLVLAQLYFDLKERELAFEFANLALTFPTDFYIKRESYAVLANVTSNKKEYNADELSSYVHMYMVCVDSIIKLESQPRIGDLEEVHTANRLVKKVNKNTYLYISLLMRISS